ncbi:heterocyst-inhibiting protein PatX [Argonema antarcticum]|uniref:heterocyst-inhibiting protein PatX n=1 Tax=Argonema antarcticum TaxID=2942763 RepID=UPI002011FF7C|nr:hypothetical protein [Argonema antarcticum]MCL1474778.1 hypothetical protein [Argonema antarcticum A004/B2]
MRLYKSILLSGLLLSGIAANCKAFEYRNSEILQKFEADRHLLADFPTPDDDGRGSGRFTTNQNLNLVANDKNPDDDDSRGSGRFTTNQNLNFVANDKNPDDDDSRGSGRFTTNQNLNFVANAKNPPNRKTFGNGRFMTDTNPNNG